MIKAPMSWEEGNKLVAEQGSGSNLATRLKHERDARGWTQARLASEMNRIGIPIPQTAIS